jgi:hypothetical protein
MITRTGHEKAVNNYWVENAKPNVWRPGHAWEFCHKIRRARTFDLCLAEYHDIDRREVADFLGSLQPA